MGSGESLVMSIMRIAIYFVAIVAILFSLLFLYKTNTSNQYISQCNEIITRSGGLTQSAYDKCNRLSKKYYHNYYHVSITPNFNNSDKLNTADKGFGENDNDGAKVNYSPHETQLGNKIDYYMYSDVPLYQNLSYDSNSGMLTKKPLHQVVSSAIRAGSQD